LRAEKRTYGESTLESSRDGGAKGRWPWGVAAPFRKCGAEEVGRETEDDEEPVRGAKGTGWGETGVVRKGTAAGRRGEEKTGGPGGVLNCAGPLGLGLPREERARGGVKTAGKGGDACAACGCSCGGVSSMPALLGVGGGGGDEREAQI
jgi:hypothetical protein